MCDCTFGAQHLERTFINNRSHDKFPFGPEQAVTVVALFFAVELLKFIGVNWQGQMGDQIRNWIKVLVGQLRKC